VAISILQKGLCRELLLNDVREGLAEGEAMDLNHGSSFFPSARVRPAEIEEMKDCKAVVVTAGRGGKPQESRLDLLNDNIKIAKSIADRLQGFNGLLIVVANPVDVLTYYYQKFSGLPVHQVIGTGTMLDTARFREIVGRKIHVDPRSVHAQVIGEHGESEVFLWSSARIGTEKLRNWEGWNPSDEEEISQMVRSAAYEIIRRKGATNHAIGLVTATLLKWLLRGERRIINLSLVQEGAYDLQDVALSLPTLVDESGAVRILPVEMNEEEIKGLYHSAEVLKKAIRSVDFYHG
jgi:L-lactate dehydrogenase